MTDSPDMQLVALARAGDRTAFGTLAERHRPAVERLALRLTGNREAAADCVQTALMRAWERLQQLREDGRFANWLLAICRSVAADMRAAESVRRRREADAAARAPAMEDPDRWSTPVWVRDAVGELPELYRWPVSQFYFEGLRQREIADALDVPLGTVKARLHRARVKLRELLAEREAPEMAQIQFTSLMEAFMQKPEPTPQLSHQELARETLKRYDLGQLRRIGFPYCPSDSIGIAVETDRGRYRLWRYQPWMTREIVELQHAMLRHLNDKQVPAKRLIRAADGSTTCFIDNHFVAVFEWFPAADVSQHALRRVERVEAMGDLNGRWVAAMADFDPPIDDWRTLASSWRPRKGWALSLPFYDLPHVPGRMGLFQAARTLADAPPYHDQFLRGIEDTQVRLKRFAKQVEALGMRDLPHGMNHGVILLGAQDFDLMVSDANDYVYEPRIGTLSHLVEVIMYAVALPGRPGYDHVKALLGAFQRHVELSEAELRALPWAALSFPLYYRVFGVLLYLGELHGGPDNARCYVPDQETFAKLDEQERDIEKLTETLLGR